MIEDRAKLIKCKIVRHNQARTFVVSARGSRVYVYFNNNAFCGNKNWFTPHRGGGGGITPGDFWNQFFWTDRKWAEDMVSFLMSFIHKNMKQNHVPHETPFTEWKNICIIYSVIWSNTYEHVRSTYNLYIFYNARD